MSSPDPCNCEQAQAAEAEVKMIRAQISSAVAYALRRHRIARDVAKAILEPLGVVLVSAGDPGKIGGEPPGLLFMDEVNNFVSVPRETSGGEG